MDAAFFARGATYTQFKEAMTRNREKLEANEAAVVIEAGDLAFFRGLRVPLRALVLAEDWCGDVVANLPVLARLAADSGKLEVRIFDKTKEPGLMQRYRKEGKYESIPVIALFDERFRELGVFIERPDSVTRERWSRTQAIHAADSAFGSPDAPAADLADDVRARLMDQMQRMRSEIKPWSDAEVVRELRAIASRATAP